MVSATDRLVWSTLSDSGIPGTRETWGPAACTPPLPYFVYQKRPHSFFADDSNYGSIPRYRAYLHTRHADTETAEAFAGKVAELGTYVRHPTEYKEGHFVHRFDFSLTRRAE